MRANPIPPAAPAPAESRVEQSDVVGCGSLLRPKDGAGAFGAAQRIAHIRGDQHLGPADRWIDLSFDPIQRREGGAAFCQLVTTRIEEPQAERAKHPCSRVVRGAAADPHQDPARAAGDRLLDQLTGAESARAKRVTLVALQKR
jgi:hypothetical protein